MDMLKKFIATSVLVSTVSTVAAQDDATAPRAGEINEDHYIITFMEPENEAERIVDPPNRSADGAEVPFGEHSSGQDPAEIERTLNLNGEVLAIFDAINAVYVRIPEEEANRLRRDPRVLAVEEDRWISAATTQNNPGWGLDRLDETTATLDNTFVYNQTGAGRTIYILDSGLNVGTTAVTNEFGSRASVVYDVNGGTGNDCNGHGTAVSSVAAGNTYGVAKGATVVMGKITAGCSTGSLISTSVTAFNWLTTNAPAGSVVNWSHALSQNDPANPCAPAYSISLDNAIFDTHQTGKMIFVAAGNDGCDTANFSPLTIPETFTVGATTTAGFAAGFDYRASFSRLGAQLDAWAPGELVAAMDHNGNAVSVAGTSFSSPYVAGLATLACAANGTLCNTTYVQTLYNSFKATGTTNTVRDWTGAALPAGVPTTFIDQQW